MKATHLKSLSSKLEDLGLTDKEAHVYLAALFLGSASVQKIADQAGVKRATAYVILGQLEKIGLVSAAQEGKTTVYIGENPQAIIRWLQRQEKDISKKKEEVKNFLPALNEIQRETANEAPQVRFYKGPEGTSSALAELIRKTKPKTQIYGVSNVDEVEKLFPGHWEKFPKNLVGKKINSKLLYWSHQKEIPNSKYFLRQTKKLSHPPQADISLMEDRAAILSYKGKDSVGILIESKEIVGVLRQLFEKAWENSNK
jgi:sugar-specific transcriptional regulator TrmB